MKEGEKEGVMTQKRREKKVRRGREVKGKKEEGESVHNVSERQLEWG